MSDMKNLLESLNEFQRIFPMFYFEDYTEESWMSDGDNVWWEPVMEDDDVVDWEYSAEVKNLPKEYQGYFICNIDLGTGECLTAIFDKSKEIK